MAIHKEVLALSRAPTKSSRAAWATYVRRRWPSKCQEMCQAEWSLSAGRVNGLVWGNVSQNTIDQILAHKRGGPFVALEVEAIRFGLSIEAFLERCAEQEREAIAHERRQFEAREARVLRLETMARERRCFGRDEPRQAALPDRRNDGGSWAEPARVGRTETVKGSEENG